jgi:hypothetical protein
MALSKESAQKIIDACNQLVQDIDGGAEIGGGFQLAMVLASTILADDGVAPAQAHRTVIRKACKEGLDKVEQALKRHADAQRAKLKATA